MRALRIILILVLVFQVTYYYPLLPERVASHFDAGGRPNGWSAKGTFFGIYAATIMLTMLIFMSPSLLLRRLPLSWISLPRRDYWLAPERRERTFAFLDAQMSVFGNAAIIFTMCMFQLVIRANLPGQRGSDMAMMWYLLAPYLIFTSWWLVRLIRRLRAGGELHS